MSAAIPLEQLATILGYTFRDVTLLETALTLPSFSHENPGAPHNQRLEFLGDAVLNLLGAEYLYHEYPNSDEGRLTQMRTALVKGEALAELAREIGIGSALRIGKSEENRSGREREGALADAMEAVLGAVWLDGGTAAANALFKRLMAPRLCDDKIGGDAQAENPKGYLQAKLQARGEPLPVYSLVEVTGDDHEPLYCAKVTLANGVFAIGRGTSKRKAEVAAAKSLLDTIRTAKL